MAKENFISPNMIADLSNHRFTPTIGETFQIMKMFGYDFPNICSEDNESRD